MDAGGSRRLLGLIWAEFRSDPPSVPRPRSVRGVVGWVIGSVLVLCCGWVLLQTVGSIASDLAFFLVPVLAMTAVVAVAVVGWRAGWLRRWSKTRVVVIALVLIVVTPVALFAGWVFKGAVDAGTGSASPAVAVYDYLSYAPFGYVWSRDEGQFRRVLCDSEEDRLYVQAGAILVSAKRAERGKTGLGEFGATDVRETGRDGDRVTLTAQVYVEYVNTDLDRKPNEWSGWRSASRLWTFQAVDRNGWRICAVTAPDVCMASDQGERQVDCDPPASPVSATSAPAREWDGRVRWECLPDAPAYFLPDRSKCVYPDGWVAPGPYKCAPGYPLVRGRDTVRECHALGWYHVS